MEHIANFFYKINIALEKIKFLESIKRAFTTLLPVFIIGAIIVLLQNIPFVSEEALASFNGSWFGSLLKIAYSATYGMSAIYLVFALTYTYAKMIVSDNRVLRIYSVLNALIVYFLSLGADVFSASSSVSILDYTDMKNIFQALLISFASIHIFLLLLKLEKKILKKNSISGRTFTLGMYSIMPIVGNVLIFGVISALIGLIPNTDINNFHDLISYIIALPFEGLKHTYGGGVLIMFLESFLWIFGIHGGNAVETVSQSYFYFNDSIVNKAFWDTFVLMGGAGTLVSLIIAILIFSKKKRNKRIGSMAIGPMVFNINEIAIFGLPIVLNPIYFIPFLLTPIVCFNLSYLAIYSGIVPHVVNNVTWTTPVLFSGAMATKSFMGLLLQVVNILIGVLIYLPFVKLDDYVTLKCTKKACDDLVKYVQSCEAQGVKTNIFALESYLEGVAEDIAEKLKNDIENGKIELFYQPIYKDERIYSMESLLRFKLNDSYLYPPLVINIAVEKGLFKDLSREIVKRAIIDQTAFTYIIPKLRVSINLQYSLIIDNEFMRWMYDTIQVSKLPKGSIAIEITEESSVPSNIDMVKIFNQIHEHDIKIYLDDFSMGHTSISYLQNNKFDYVKLDGAIVKDIENERSKEIIKSIISLGSDLGFDIVAEYVENKSIKDTLYSMGCFIYQGYYYSKPLSKNDTIIKLHKEANEAFVPIEEPKKKTRSTSSAEKVKKAPEKKTTMKKKDKAPEKKTTTRKTTKK